MTILAIRNHPTYKAVLADSFGGVLYNMGNAGKYEGKLQVLKLWDGLTEREKDSADGVMKSAISFLKEG